MRQKGFTPHHFAAILYSKTKLWFRSFKLRQNGAGFTLIELLVVSGIIIFLLAIILINLRQAGGEFKLQRSAHKLTQDIRRASGIAMSAQVFKGSVPAGGYGVYFNFPSDKTSYVLYADKNGNEKYDGSDGVLETIFFEQGVEIKSASQNNLSVNFKPPSPTIKIGGGVSSAAITLGLETNSGATKTVQINAVGLIEVK